MIYFICELLNKSKFFKYYLITPWVYAIGTCGEHISIGNRIARQKHKKLIIIKLNIFKKFLKYHICNEDLFENLELDPDYTKTYKIVRSLFTILINIEFVFLRTLVIINDKTIKVKLPEYLRFPQIGIKSIIYNDKNFFNLSFKDIQKYPENPSINLNKNFHKKIKIVLNKKFNIGEKKFICLHVRDGKFRNDIDRRALRNSDINSYIPAIKYLIENGYIVFRLGNYESNKINFKDENFIELNNTDPQNFFDIWLIKNCYFYIGTSSGPVDVSYLFNKPTLITNANSFFINFPRTRKDRIIFKKPVFNDKVLNLQEHLDLPFKFHNYLEDYGNINLIDNTENEILNAVKEFDFNMKNNKFDLNDKQVNLNKLLYKNIENHFLNSKNNNFKNFYLAKNMIRWIKTQEGAVSLSFF